jgi:hypothetical protein
LAMWLPLPWADLVRADRVLEHSISPILVSIIFT